MLLKTKSGHLLELPSQEESLKINAGIAADPDTYELSSAEFSQLKRMGRPKAAVTKQRVTIRLSRKVVDEFRATGAGWQTKIDAALVEYIKEHPLRS